MVRHGPSTASGGTTTLHPRAVGQAGVDDRAGTGRPAARAGATIRSTRASAVALVDARPRCARAGRRARPTPRPAVDHDLGDRRVGEQRLERPEPVDPRAHPLRPPTSTAAPASSGPRSRARARSLGVGGLGARRRTASSRPPVRAGRGEHVDAAGHRASGGTAQRPLERRGAGGGRAGRRRRPGRPAGRSGPRPRPARRARPRPPAAEARDPARCTSTTPEGRSGSGAGPAERQVAAAGDEQRRGWPSAGQHPGHVGRGPLARLRATTPQSTTTERGRRPAGAASTSARSGSASAARPRGSRREAGRDRHLEPGQGVGGHRRPRRPATRRGPGRRARAGRARRAGRRRGRRAARRGRRGGRAASASAAATTVVPAPPLADQQDDEHGILPGTRVRRQRASGKVSGRTVRAGVGAGQGPVRGRRSAPEGRRHGRRGPAVWSPRWRRPSSTSTRRSSRRRRWWPSGDRCSGPGMITRRLMVRAAWSQPRLPLPRRRRGAHAQASASRRCGSPGAGTRRPISRARARDAHRRHRADRLRRGARAHPRAPRRRPPGVHRVGLTRGDRRAARRLPRGRRGRSPPGPSSTTTAATPARSSSTPTARTRSRRCEEVADERGHRPRPRATPTATRPPTCRCSLGRPPGRGEPRPRAGPRRQARGLAGAACSATACRCASGWRCRRRSRLAMGAAVAGGVAAGVVVGWWIADPAPGVGRPAQASWSFLTAKAARATTTMRTRSFFMAAHSRTAIPSGERLAARPAPRRPTGGRVASPRPNPPPRGAPDAARGPWRRSPVPRARRSPSRRSSCPTPGPGEALVRVQACGVCHTDLHYREGGINDDFPFLLGHEAAGVVEAVGPDVTERRARRLRHPQLAGGVRRVPGVPARAALVLLRHPQRHAEDDARPTAPSCRPRSASARSPRRRSSPPARPRRSTPARRPEAAGLLGCGVMAGLGAAMLHRRRRPRRHASPCSAAAAWATPRSPGARLAGATTIIAVDLDAAQARVGQATSAPPTPSTRRDDRPGRGHPGRSPTATAPTCASRRSATRRCSSRRSTPATSPARSCRSACPTPDMTHRAPDDRVLRPGRRAQAVAGTATACRAATSRCSIDLYLQGRLDLDRFVVRDDRPRRRRGGVPQDGARRGAALGRRAREWRSIDRVVTDGHLRPRRRGASRSTTTSGSSATTTRCSSIDAAHDAAADRRRRSRGRTVAGDRAAPTATTTTSTPPPRCADAGRRADPAAPRRPDAVGRRVPRPRARRRARRRRRARASAASTLAGAAHPGPLPRRRAASTTTADGRACSAATRCSTAARAPPGAPTATAPPSSLDHREAADAARRDGRAHRPRRLHHHRRRARQRHRRGLTPPRRRSRLRSDRGPTGPGR